MMLATLSNIRIVENMIVAFEDELHCRRLLEGMVGRRENLEGNRDHSINRCPTLFEADCYNANWNVGSPLPVILQSKQQLAERVGFEPTIPLQVCRISSAVHSTTLPPLRMFWSAPSSARRFIAAVWRDDKG
jgi:hypothetical protein